MHSIKDDIVPGRHDFKEDPFSTRIYLNLQYDNGVTKNEDFNSYFQINELLSFGFNYK